MCFGYGMVAVNVRDMVIKFTNMSDELMEAFDIGCQLNIPVSKVIKVTNWDSMMIKGQGFKHRL